MPVPGGYLARLPRTTSVHLTRPWVEIAEQVSPIPTMPAMTTTLLGVSVRAIGRLPWVATLHGFVVLGGDLTGSGSTIGTSVASGSSRPASGSPSRGGRPGVIIRGRVP
jgi:hypothetical protein